MSFSNPKLTNPAKKFIEFKGDKGVFQYWDSTKEENIILELPCYFIILDQLNTVVGYSEKYNCAIYSNEVHSLTDEILRVKTFKGNFSAIGKYSDIKAELKEIGGKFCKSVYVMIFNENGETELVNFKFTGASFGSFLDAKINPNTNSVCILNEFSDEKKGNVNYKKPVFKKYNIQESLIQKAIDMDKELQIYLNQYKNKKIEETIELNEKTEEISNDLPENEILTFEKENQKSKIINEPDDLPF